MKKLAEPLESKSDFLRAAFAREITAISRQRAKHRRYKRTDMEAAE